MTKLIFRLLSIVLLLLMGGCNETLVSPTPKITDTLPTYIQKTTLAEASKNLTFAIPFPKYLLYNEKIQEVYLEGDHIVVYIISDGNIDKQLVTRTTENGKTFQEYEFQCSMTIRIQWHGGGIEPTFIILGVQPKITPRQGIIHFPQIVERTNTKRLDYYWNPNSVEPAAYAIGIVASNQTSNEELVKIAESIRF